MKIIRSSFRFLFVPLLGASLIGSACAETTSFPDDAGLINVKTQYGAVGDGVTDDTAALQKAISENVYHGPTRTIYFPIGTYLVSAPLRCVNEKGVQGHRLSFQGEDRDKTIIKLKDHAAPFQDPAKSNPVLITGNTPGPANNGFQNSVWNLTIDIGAGNPGANGLEWRVCNLGSLRDLTVRSSDPQGAGNIGIIGGGWPGPALMKNVLIEGFDTGIDIHTDRHSLTFESITLRHQRKLGISNPGNAAAIHDLISENTVPVIRAGTGLTVLVDGKLTGGASSSSAAIIQGTGALFCRNVQTAGYPAAIADAGGKALSPGPDITEYTSSAPRMLFNSIPQSLNLPIEDYTYVHDNNFNDWANVAKYGAVDKDATAAIQAAMDSGKPVVYFPLGNYIITKTIHVGPKVRAILGMNSVILANRDFPFDSSTPMFRIEGNSQDLLMIDRLIIVNEDETSPFQMIDASTRPLALRDGCVQRYRNDPGAGKLFVEDQCPGFFNGWTFDHQDVWMRQFNPEALRTIKVINKGGKVWILGLKTEMPSIAVLTTDHGQTEVLGAYLFCNAGSNTIPLFVTKDSDLSASYFVFHYRPELDFAIHAREIRGDEVKDLYRWDGENPMALYVARSSNPPATAYPDLTLSLPTRNQVFEAPATIPLQAGVVGANPPANLKWEIKSFASYANHDQGADTIATALSGEWKGVPPGLDFVYAKATDDQGNIYLSNTVPVIVKPPKDQLGSILWQYWEHASVSNLISDLERDPAFPQHPDLWGYASQLAFNPDKLAVRYDGFRLTGAIHPPTTGDYTFWISSGDQSVLRLSTDESPLHKRLIAWAEKGSGVKTQDWDASPERKSSPISLEAGKAYYIEAVLKNNPHAEIGWSGPNIPRQVIPGNDLSPADPTAAEPAPPDDPLRVTLPSSFSFYVRGGGTQNNNIGGTTMLISSSDKGGQQTFLQFNLASVSGKIGKALLRLYPDNVLGTVSDQLALVSENQQVNHLTNWKNKPASVPTSVPAWTPVAGTPCSIDVTDLVKSAASSPDKLLSVQLINASGSGTVTYASGLAPRDLQPELEIQYSP